ncbi:MAG: GGDEF domain-containing protein [Planctomycetota bacterium]|nr:GGDEF domain-containing protein [Planctomycetota bacterium]
MAERTLLERVLESPKLPSLPAVALEVIELVQQRDLDFRQIARTISHDPALTAKILKTVNSSFYGHAHTIGTISQALVVLGLNTIKTLALGFTLVGNLKQSCGSGFDLMTFWRRSLHRAVAAKVLTKHAGIPQQEEAFLGGLLQDLGILAMSQTLEGEFDALMVDTGLDPARLSERTRERYGTDPLEIGVALGQQWNLPPVLIVAMRFRGAIEQAPAEFVPIVRCITLGDNIADVFLSDVPGPALANYHKNALEWLGISAEKANELLESSHESCKEMQRLLELPTGPLGNAKEVLARANETLLQLSLAQQVQSAELEQQNRKLAEQAITDPLTGAANRRRFNDYIAAQFDLAPLNGEPVSLLFLDVDHFKKFNDTYGHQSGDNVLVQVATTLRRLLPPPCLVARYGGEEFAAVLPGVDRNSASRAAELVRRAIAQAVVHAEDGQKLSVTASIGVATFDGTVFSRVEQFIKASDQGVYAAKAAGRNCVRIFTPRPKAAA